MRWELDLNRLGFPVEGLKLWLQMVGQARYIGFEGPGEGDLPVFLHPKSWVESWFPASDRVERIVLLMELHHERFPIWAGAAVGSVTEPPQVIHPPVYEFGPGLYEIHVTVRVWTRDGNLWSFQARLDQQAE